MRRKERKRKSFRNKTTPQFPEAQDHRFDSIRLKGIGGWGNSKTARNKRTRETCSRDGNKASFKR